MTDRPLVTWARITCSAAQFESFRDPLTIMLTVPLALTDILSSRILPIALAQGAGAEIRVDEPRVPTPESEPGSARSRS